MNIWKKLKKCICKLGERGSTLTEVSFGLAALTVTAAIVVVAVDSGVNKIEVKVHLANQSGIVDQAKKLLVEEEYTLADGDEIFVSLNDMLDSVSTSDPSNSNEGYDLTASGVLLVNENGVTKAYTQLKKKADSYCYLSQTSSKAIESNKMKPENVSTPKNDDRGVTCQDIAVYHPLFSDV